MATAAIRVEAVSKRYGRTLALDALSVEVAEREVFALLGPNGAGKSTLVQILCTLALPDSGKASLAGFDVVTEPLRARRHLGVVFQEPSLDDRLTVTENLEFHGLVYGVPAKLRRARIEEMLRLVELVDWRDALVRTLSAGMKRRLEIARALVHDSRILILDEPTVGLDAQSRARLWEHLQALRLERGLTIVVTTHYIEEVESCDRVAIVDHGKLLALDTPTALKAAHGREFLRVVPVSEPVAQEILAAYPGRAAKEQGAIVLGPDGPDFTQGFLAAFGTRIKALTVERPSLESVFLGLTGRALRDQPATARQRTQAFGRQGGELTR